MFTRVANIKPAYVQRLVFSRTSQQTRYIHPILDQCWSTVYDAGPTLVQYWVDVSCLLGWASCAGFASALLQSFRPFSDTESLISGEKSTIPASTGSWTDSGLLLAHCLSRLSKINPLDVRIWRHEFLDWKNYIQCISLPVCNIWFFHTLPSSKIFISLFQNSYLKKYSTPPPTPTNIGIQMKQKETYQTSHIVKVDILRTS